MGPARPVTPREPERRNGVRAWAIVVATLVGVLGTLGAGLVKLDSRYAKAEELGQIHREIQCIARDLKLGQLRTREILLINEQTTLEVTRRQRTLTPVEIQTYNHNALELVEVQNERKDLQNQTGCS